MLNLISMEISNFHKVGWNCFRVEIDGVRQPGFSSGTALALREREQAIAHLKFRRVGPGPLMSENRRGRVLLTIAELDARRF